jgi:secreted PhoX family phosphatase
MNEDDKTEGLTRRGFLSGATAAGLAAVPLAKTSTVAAQEAVADAAAAPLPNAAQAAMEHEVPEGYTGVQAANYFVDHPGPRTALCRGYSGAARPSVGAN